METFLAADNQLELFLAEAVLSEENIMALEEANKTRSQGEIGSLFRSKSYISIGEPIALPLAQLLARRGAAVPADIQLQMKQYDFYHIQLACSFEPAPSCRFSSARLGLTLQTVPAVVGKSAQAKGDNAIAYDLFPQKIEDEFKVSRKYGLTPELKLSFASVSSQLALISGLEVNEYIVYKGHIKAFDLQGTRPAWSFVRTPSHEIAGTQKLFMIIRKPKGTQVKATLELSAHVQFMIGGRLPLDPLPLVTLFRPSSTRPIITDEPTIPLC